MNYIQYFFQMIETKIVHWQMISNEMYKYEMKILVHFHSIFLQA
jgi:hypothetical protein